MQRSVSTFGAAAITVHGAEFCRRKFPRRLRDSSPLHVNSSGDVFSSAWGLPSVLQEGVYYAPVHVEDAACSGNQHLQLVASAATSVRVFILWPALQDPPSWLRNRFQQLKGTQLKVAWAFTLKQRAILNLTNRRQAFEEQPLQVWQLLKVLPPGSAISLPGPALPVKSTSLPLYGYVVAFKAAVADLTATAATLAAKLLASRDANPLTCTLQQLRACVEDGAVSLHQLPAFEINALFYRCMTENDNELLLLLLEQGFGTQLTIDTQQDLLQYAASENQLQLMQQVLSAGAAELSQSLLEWWIKQLVSSTNSFDVERLLAAYCLARRNPLSAVAAIETALWQLGGSFGQAGANNSIMALLMLKFGAVKHTMLQQLLDRDAQHQITQAQFGNQPLPGEVLPTALLQQYYSPAAQSNLQHMISACMACKQPSAISIHDSSPYAGAMQLNDTHMLNVREVVNFTQQLWHGFELQQLWGRGSRHARTRRRDSSRALVKPAAAGSWKTAAVAVQAASLLKHSSQGPGSNEGKSAAAEADVTAAADADSAGPGFSNSAGPSLQEPSVGYELLQNMGFAARGRPDLLAYVVSYLVHIMLLSPRAFFNSPRGQWIMHCCIELLFLMTYQVLVNGYQTFELEVLMLALVIGNLIRVLTDWWVKYRGDLRRYLSRSMSILDLVVHLGLIATAVGVITEGFGEDSWTVDVAAALAVPLWARALGVVVPANARLGALLHTFGRMVEEAFSMGLIIVVLIMGFSTTLCVRYSSIMEDYSSFAGALRMMVGVMAGDLHLQEFAAAAHGDVFYAWFGQACTILFIIVVNILLMSLLIAVINHKYHPEGVAKQTTVMFAEAASAYAWQAENGQALTPLNVLQLLMAWVPRRWRKRLPHASCLRLWLPPVDGFYSAARHKSQSSGLIPTGPAELSYLLFLLTLYPLAAVAAVVLFVLRIPAAVVHFTRQGYKMWFSKKTRYGKGKGSWFNRDSRSSFEGSYDTGAGGTATGWRRAFSRHAAVHPLEGGGPLSLRGRGPMSPRAPMSPRGQIPGRDLRQTEPSVLRGLRLGATWMLAATVALAVQLLLAVLLFLALAYSLLAQVLWTCWCVMFWWLLPQNMVVDQLPERRLSADFWSRADLEAIFRQHKVMHGPGFSRGSHLVSSSNDRQQTPGGNNHAKGPATTLHNPPSSPSAREHLPGGARALSRSTSLRQHAGGPVGVPAAVYAECGSLAEHPGSISGRRRSSLLAPPSMGATAAAASLVESSSNSGSSSNATGTTASPWLMNQLSNVLYPQSDQPPAGPASLADRAGPVCLQPSPPGPQATELQQYADEHLSRAQLPTYSNRHGPVPSPTAATDAPGPGVPLPASRLADAAAFGWPTGSYDARSGASLSS